MYNKLNVIVQEKLKVGEMSLMLNEFCIALSGRCVGVWCVNNAQLIAVDVVAAQK